MEKRRAENEEQWSGEFSSSWTFILKNAAKEFDSERGRHKRIFERWKLNKISVKIESKTFNSSKLKFFTPKSVKMLTKNLNFSQLTLQVSKIYQISFSAWCGFTNLKNCFKFFTIDSKKCKITTKKPVLGPQRNWTRKVKQKIDQFSFGHFKCCMLHEKEEEILVREEISVWEEKKLKFFSWKIIVCVSFSSSNLAVLVNIHYSVSYATSEFLSYGKWSIFALLLL